MTDQSIENLGAEHGDFALEHAVSDKTYVMVAIFLAVMTGLEVLCSYTEDQLGPFYDWALIVLMTIKFLTVALFFMHLKFDHAMCKKVFFFGLGIAVIVYCMMLGTFHFFAPHFR